MKNSKAILVVLLSGLMLVMVFTPVYGQENWEKGLAQDIYEGIRAVQQICKQRGKVECELIEITKDPPFLAEGQVIDYVGVRMANFLYVYLVASESDKMNPDIYLFDSSGRLLQKGRNITGPRDWAAHIPDYTQKIIIRIRMSKGSGHIAVAVLAPVVPVQ